MRTALADNDPKVQLSNENRYDARLDVYSRMAYFLAKELSMRPWDILNNWSREEVAVAYGVYVNERTAENFQMEVQNATPANRREKPKMPKWEDRWGVLFATAGQLRVMERELAEAKDKRLDKDDLMEAAKVLFG